MGVNSDVLYPAYQQREIVELVNAGGGRADLVEIDSPHGHDAFLIEVDQVGDAVRSFLDDVEKDDA
jgi:homoserine O-acetyltransferase